MDQIAQGDDIFCKIIKGELPSYKILENEEFLAFLTIAPHTPGHTLVIPKKHTEYIFDLDDKLLSKILVFAKPIAAALKKAFNPRSGKIGVIIAGQGVPHVHIHLISMDQEEDLHFDRANHGVSPEELKEVQEKILQELR